MEELIKKLAEAWGPPGFEHHVRNLIRAEIEDIADEITVDALGNMICRIGSGPKRVMTAAHMDEIGLIIGFIDRNGFARFAPVGGLFPATLLGSRVRFENGAIGTIGVDHQFTKRREALPSASGFFIDISKDADHNADVQVGDPGAFVADVFRRGDRIIGKCLDDRAGCAIQVEAMRRIKAKGTPHSLYFAFTVQEEVGVRGAAPAAFGIEPNFAIAIDATATGDVPHGRNMAVSLGDGAAIKARDSGLIVPGPVKDLMVRRAQEAGVLFQIEVLESGSTDGKAIQNVRAGVPTGVLSFPVRYVHTTSETADLHDIEAVITLLVEILTKEIPL